MKRLLFLLLIIQSFLFSQEPKKELSDFVFRQRVAIVPSTITSNWFGGTGTRLRVKGTTYIDTVRVDNYIIFGGGSTIPIYFSLLGDSWIERVFATSVSAIKIVSKDDGTFTSNASTSIEIRNNTNISTLSRVIVSADGYVKLNNSTYDYYVGKSDDHKWYINGVQKMGLPNSGILTTNGIANTGNITSSGNLTSADITADNLTLGGSMTSYFVVAKTKLQAEIYDVGAVPTITPDKPTSIISGTTTAIALPDIDYTEGDATYNVGAIYTFKRENYSATITLQTPADAYFESTGMGVDYTWTGGTYGTLTIQATYHDNKKHWIIISRVDY